MTERQYNLSPKEEKEALRGLEEHEPDIIELVKKPETEEELYIPPSDEEIQELLERHGIPVGKIYVEGKD